MKIRLTEEQKHYLRMIETYQGFIRRMVEYDGGNVYNDHIAMKYQDQINGYANKFIETLTN